MADDEGERLDWGNDDDEQQNASEPYAGYSPRQSAGGYTGATEDAEDAISLGGDDEDEREYFANHSPEQAPGAHLTKQPSFTSHSGKRDGRRLSAATPSRTPSRAKNSESPTRESRPPNSASSTGKLPPAPLIHGLPPKPVLVPPLFEQPSEPGILASAMVNRPRKSNGAKGPTASDSGDPLPPDWEIRYSTSEGKAYYYNINTEESTWTRPRLQVTSGRSSPTKNCENGGAQLSGRHSPDVQDEFWSERTGRSQQPRPARRDVVSRRASPPPNSALSYADRHYRPRGEATEAANTGEWRDERGPAGQSYNAEPSYGRARSPSPILASEGRRGSRSTSPQWDRRAQRDISPSPQPDRGMWRDAQRDYSQDRQAGVSDSGWSRSQEHPEPLQSAPRSPSARRDHRRDGIEPPVRRRKDDIESVTRRKDDLEPRRRKDDIEPRIRRKDDIEPPIRTLPSREPSARHVNDEWPGSRQRSPPPHLREPSLPRRANPPLPPSSNSGYSALASSSSKEVSRYERIDNPPPTRYKDNVSSDNLPQRRGRDMETSDPSFDNLKRRRLNDDFGSSRRGPTDFVAPVVSLPPKPMAASPPYEVSQVDQPPRRRAPLPPQREQWIKSDPKPASVQHQPSQQPAIPPRPIRIPSPTIEPNGMSHWTRPDGQQVTVNPVNQLPPGYMGQGKVPLYDTPSGRISRMASMPNPWDTGKSSPLPRPKNSRPNPRLSDAMDIDVPPPVRESSMARVDTGPRNGMGGMYSDRMQMSAPQEAPRAPRAMVPRDSGFYSAMPSSSTSMPNLYPRPAEPPSREGPPQSSGRGRLQSARSPVEQRRWGESFSADRRASYSGPNSVEPLTAPVVRDLPERPMGIGRPPNAELRGRGRPSDDVGSRPPPRMSGTNSVPVGPRTVTSYENVLSAQPPPFHSADNGYGSRRQFSHDRGDDVSDPYGKKSMRYAPTDEPLPDRLRGERGSDRDTERGGHRPSVSDTMRGLPEERQPSRGGVSPVQSRFGSTYPLSSQSEPRRLWQTRDEAQTLRGSSSRSLDDLAPRETRQYGRSAYDSESSRPDRAMTPPPNRRDEEQVTAVKVHPDRARLLTVAPPAPLDTALKGARGRRPGSDRGPTGVRDFDERVRDPPYSDDSRMGPPRARSPQNGFRPNIKRGGSLLERLNINDSSTPTHDGVSSLRERVDVTGHGSVDPVPLAHAEPMTSMNVDSEGTPGSAGDDGPKGNGGRGAARKRTGKPRRGRRGGLS